ncbi:MAG: antibiotic biosynthesis monooxygenase [Steroidobacteraceae bacterium]
MSMRWNVDVIAIYLSLTAKSGRGRELRERLIELAAVCRLDKGCLMYTVNIPEATESSLNDETLFVYEQYAGEAGLAEHRANEEVQRLSIGVRDATAHIQIVRGHLLSG